MFTSKVLEGYSITPKSAEAEKMLNLLVGEEGIKAAKALQSLFAVTEIDYCELMQDIRTPDIMTGFARVQFACAEGNYQQAIDEMSEISGAIEAGCTAERKAHGVSTRYQFSATSGKWSKRESAPRKPAAEGVTVGEPKPEAKKLYHQFTGNDGFRTESTNGGKLYHDVHAHYAPNNKATEHTDFKNTALPYFSKHGKYTTEVK